jgi:hypothetical protein
MLDVLFWFALMIYEASGSIQVVKRMCGVHMDHVLRCFDNLEG